MGYRVCVVGATGVVGQAILSTLTNRNFPVDNIVLFASHRSEGLVFHFKNKPVSVQKLQGNLLKDFDFSFFTAGTQVSKEFVPVAQKNGSIVVDNSGAFRLNEDVPLVVPEVNPEELKKHKGLISNPNCMVIQIVIALSPIKNVAGLKKIIISTYQAVSGAGGRALFEFENEITHKMWNSPFERQIFPRQIAFNVIPQIPQKNAFNNNGFTSEEQKIIAETRKILKLPDIDIVVTAVRVPVFNGHCASVYFETEKDVSKQEVIDTLKNFSGIVVCGDEDYPTPAEISGRHEVFVGRIRKTQNGFVIWVVADNILKGAALNAIQIAEKLIEK
jgi:aspartate-semialdehyde dehydrogenase